MTDSEVSSRPRGAEALFEQAASRYDDVGVAFFRPHAAELVHRAGIGTGERVLDVGCGRGAVTMPAATAVGPTGAVTATDLAPTMVRLTQEDVRRAGLDHVSVSIGDAADPQFADGSFDVVTAGLVVFMLLDPVGALGAYARVLRAGGRVAFSTFAQQDAWFSEAMRAFASHTPTNSGPPGGRGGPFGSEESTREVLAEAGFGAPAFSTFEVRSDFRGPEHWLEWAWSHGTRGILQQVPEDRFAAATEAAFAVLEDVRAADGSLTLTTTTRITVAPVAV